jgi:hypothetical protein
MKNKTRRLASVLVAMLLLALSAVPASAYTAVTGGTVTVQEELHVAGSVIPNVTYELKTTSNMTGYSNGGVDYFYAGAIDASKFPTGTSLATLSFGPTDTLPADGKLKKNFSIDLSSLSFTQPGIYYWTVEKVASGAGATGDPKVSNEKKTLYLVVRVVDNNGSLEISYGLSESLSSTTKINSIVDNYPAKEPQLTIEKLVRGALGSKDQYFMFTVNLSGMSAVAGNTLPVNTAGGPGTPATTLFGEPANYTNPTSVTIGADGTASVVFWLKDNEDVSIKLIQGATYNVTETEEPGYTSEYKIVGEGDYVSGLTTGNHSIGESAVEVLFRNTKDATVPTGVLLSVAPAIAVITIGGAGLLIMLASRKRKQH